MVELTFTSPEPEQDPFARGPSKIVFSLIEEDSCHWTKWTADPHAAVHSSGKRTAKEVPVGLAIDEMQWDGGDADIENESGMLDCAIYGLLNHDQVDIPGWWVMEGFEADYWTDYWGEHDASFSCKLVRRAHWQDLLDCGMMRNVWWRRLVAWLFNPEVKSIAQETI